MTGGTDDPLRIDDDQRVRTFTLDRPQALNAFNEELYDAFAEGLNDAAQDADVAVAVLTGAGRAVRCVGDVGRRSGRDSNPRALAGRRFSRPVHSSALPPLRRRL